MPPTLETQHDNNDDDGGGGGGDVGEVIVEGNMLVSTKEFHPPNGRAEFRPGEKQKLLSQIRRDRWLEAYKECSSIAEACRTIGVTPEAYRVWRNRYPPFRRQVEHLKLTKTPGGSKARIEDVPEMGLDWRSASFQNFRQHYFKTKTPDFQLEVVNSYQNTQPGTITMILLPPEHGKTTLFEDYATWKLALHPAFRFAVGSESQAMSRKILSRVKLRMDPAGPFPAFVRDWGPFIPQTRGGKGRGKTVHAQQPWGADWFNVYKKQDQDERDYNMVALGITSQIAGTRTDHLHIDDVVSMNNVNQSIKIVQKIRQDWLSRPGQRGRTTINGTRVDIGDPYEILESELSERLLKIVRMPAIVERGDGPEPLWTYNEKDATGWTMDMLDRQRELVGEEAWARNYMQQPIASGESTFTEEAIGRCLNPMRSQLHPAVYGNGPLVITCDPSIGGKTAFAVLQFQTKKLLLLESRLEEGLSTNADIIRIIQQLLLDWQVTGNTVTDIIIETVAFQKGLIKEQSFLELRDRYGFRIKGHLTNNNKYDENIGVPSMATSFMRGDVDIAYAEDTRTRYNSDALKRELLTWRPKISGARLRQDRLMSLWFGWIEWRDRSRAGIMDLNNSQGISQTGLGYKKTEARLGLGGAYDYA